ncbi:UNVERIFIED_CONTAM: hypothetical protein Slati_1977600 [Sesamum latifolium]|uniref:Peptidase S26 domain-containing protein n=1 Tax=Sesamum latifolium TaxID=2727402 RepID=A0AAW2WKU4_9LAMI
MPFAFFTSPTPTSAAALKYAVSLLLVPLRTASPAKSVFLDALQFVACGPSMLPTFNHGTYVLSESITSRLGKVGSGDAVLIRSPEEPRKVVAKRVKGVEGDVVSYVLDPSKSEQKTVVVIVFLNLFSPFLRIYKKRNAS